MGIVAQRPARNLLDDAAEPCRPGAPAPRVGCAVSNTTDL